MALFEKEHFGKPISEKLSNYLRTYTGKHDRANVSVKTGVSTSTIRYVSLRTNTLTEGNSEAIIELMRIAIRNCTLRVEKATEAKEELTEMLSK